MSHDRTKNELYNVEPLSNQPEPLHGLDYKPQFGDIQDIKAEAYICVYGRTPKMDGGLQGLVKSAGTLSKLSDLQNLVSGGYSSMSSLATTYLEGAFTPNIENLAQAAHTVQQRNLRQLGFSVFVRTKYKEFCNGTFFNGWDEKYSEWIEYPKGGYNDKGHYESMSDINGNVIRKAMQWGLSQFSKNH